MPRSWAQTKATGLSQRCAGVPSTMNGRLRVDARGLWERAKFEAFAEADCFALPSQTENFGNAAAEAAAVGLPVVVSDACGVAEILDPSAHRVIGVGAVDALTAAVVELIRERRAEARRGGRARPLFEAP